MAKLPNATALVTLEEAADYAGYRSVSTLRKAARAGTLRVVRHGARTILTTHDWVADYENLIYGRGGRPRGRSQPHAIRPTPASDEERKDEERKNGWLLSSLTHAARQQG